MLKSEYEEWKKETIAIGSKLGVGSAWNMYKLLIVVLRMDAMEEEYEKLRRKRQEYELRRGLDIAELNEKYIFFRSNH